jgi:hypothetical protein
LSSIGDQQGVGGVYQDQVAYANGAYQPLGTIDVAVAHLMQYRFAAYLVALPIAGQQVA